MSIYSSGALMMAEKLESAMTCSSSEDLRFACVPIWGAHLMGRWRTSNVGTSSEIQGDDQSGCVTVSFSPARPNAGRYRPTFNSKSLGTP
jgi:hypothetical protein